MHAAAAYISELVAANKLPKTERGTLVQETVRGEVAGP